MRRVSISDPSFTYDPEDAEGFRAGMFRFGPDLGAKETGTTVYELPPGESVCPYHYEYGEEEWLIVLEGEPTLRVPDGERRLRPWDVCAFPVGPEGAHGVRNETGSVVRVLMFSEVKVPGVCVYPDSDKIGVFLRNDDDILVPRSAGVDYFHGEPGVPPSS
jgi:uncharacterized cupin superfamily protein